MFRYYYLVCIYHTTQRRGPQSYVSGTHENDKNTTAAAAAAAATDTRIPRTWHVAVLVRNSKSVRTYDMYEALKSTRQNTVEAPTTWKTCTWYIVWAWSESRLRQTVRIPVRALQSRR